MKRKRNRMKLGVEPVSLSVCSAPKHVCSWNQMQMLSLPHLVQAPSNDLEQARKEILYNSLNIKGEYSYYF